MKLWEKCFATIYNFFARQFIPLKTQLNLEKFLSGAFDVMHNTSINQVIAFTNSQVHKNGFFIDKAGNPDLYYSLFGFFVAESLQLNNIKQKIANTIKSLDISTIKHEVNMFCFVILRSQLTLDKKNDRQLKQTVIHLLDKKEVNTSNYTWFMGIITLFYLKDFYSIQKYLKKFHATIGTCNTPDKPSTIITAEIILNKIYRKPTGQLTNQLINYYRSSGGFAAFVNSPVEDLLSTAVCLFALKFAKTDLRLIKPATIGFIESLYYDGGFLATKFDKDTDIEYTFYGLLAMACLN